MTDLKAFGHPLRLTLEIYGRQIDATAAIVPPTDRPTVRFDLSTAYPDAMINTARLAEIVGAAPGPASGRLRDVR